MFDLVGRVAVGHPWKIVGLWIAAALAVSFTAPRWESNSQDDDIHFLPARCDSVRGYQLLGKAFPHEIFASRAVFALERNDGPLRPTDFVLADRMTAELEALRAEEPNLAIGKIMSYKDGPIGKRLTSADGRCTLIQVSLTTPYMAVQTQQTVDRAEARLKPLLSSVPCPPRLLTTGAAGVGRDLIRASANSLDHTTIATVLLVVAILLLVYRAPLLALVPLATIVLAVWVAVHLLALMTLIPGIHLVNVSKVFAIVILYGAGTDYCLFLISRYREELSGGRPGDLAMRRSIRAVGAGLAASAGTVICGLSLMGFAEFAKVRCAGPAIALALSVGLFASLTLTPALIQLLGSRVFWPGKPPGAADPLAIQGLSPSGLTARDHGPGNWDYLWESISGKVVRRPLLVWTVSVLLLLPLAVIGLNVRPAYRPTGELSTTSPSIQGMKAIQDHYHAGETGPLTVMLSAAAEWDSPEGRQLIGQVSKEFARMDNVAEVRSLTQPLGSWLPPPAPKNGLLSGFLKAVRPDAGNLLEQAHQTARNFYLATIDGPAGQDHVTRLDVILHSDPFDPASTATLDRMQTWLREELPRSKAAMGWVEYECFGQTVHSRDLADVTESDRARVNLLVLGGIFLILLVLLRHVWVAAYLLLTVLFSYFATLGATALTAAVWSGRPLDQMDWRVPFFLFTILVAVGEDYNILLVTRILQERRRHGTEEGTRRGLSRTGGTITACGLIMAGTFATLMLSGLNTLVQIGFALAFGVLLDTFVVRPFLVPTFMLLMWRGPDGSRSRATEQQTAEPKNRTSRNHSQAA